MRVPFLSFLSIDIAFSLTNHFLPSLVDLFNLWTAAILNFGYRTGQAPTPHIRTIMPKFDVGASPVFYEISVCAFFKIVHFSRLYNFSNDPGRTPISATNWMRWLTGFLPRKKTQVPQCHPTISNALFGNIALLPVQLHRHLQVSEKWCRQPACAGAICPSSRWTQLIKQAPTALLLHLLPIGTKQGVNGVQCYWKNFTSRKNQKVPKNLARAYDYIVKSKLHSQVQHPQNHHDRRVTMNAKMKVGHTDICFLTECIFCANCVNGESGY